MNGWRNENMEKEVKAKLISTLSDSELERIKMSRSFEELKKDSLSRKLALLNDPVRRGIVKFKSDIEKMFWDISNIKTQMARMRQQLLSGTIIDEIKPGILMNKDEIEVNIVHAQNLSENIAKDIITRLFEIRRLVGCHDPENKIIMDEEQFDVYANDIISRAKRLGYDILDQ
jgi:hypothetical protein